MLWSSVRGGYSRPLAFFTHAALSADSPKFANGSFGWHHSLLESEREGGKSVSVEENKRLAREAIKIWTTGDLDATDALYAPDYVNHQHHDPEDPRDLHGVQAMKTFAQEFREAFPDFHDSIDIQLAEADMVATRFTCMGTHRSAFMGVEPTNRELAWTPG